MKRFVKILTLSLFICLLCVLTLTSCEDGPSEGLIFTFSEKLDGYVVAKIGTCTDSNIVIPSEYDGKKVVAVGLGAFLQNDKIKSVTLPDSIVYIDQFAFAECENLTKVVIPNSVERIDNHAFYGCISLEKITLPDSIKSIGRGSFDDTVYYHTADNWENGVLYIGKHLVAADFNLETCTVKDGTLTIANSAFLNHQKLTQITIPSSVTAIDNYTFNGCTGLTKINLPSSLIVVGEYAFSGCKSLTAFTVPSSVTTLGKGALRYCHGLTEITIPESVTTVGEGVFEKCSALAKIHCSTSSQPAGWHAEWTKGLPESTEIIWG